MVIATEFLDPFSDDIVAFPVEGNQSKEWNANIIELIIGAVIFLAIVAIYNALFSIWERIFGTVNVSSEEENSGELRQQDDVFVRVTYALLVTIIAYLLVWYLSPVNGRFNNVIRWR